MKAIEPTLPKQPQVKTAFSAQDKTFMLRAIKLAKKGRFTTSPNPNVGCVLVDYQEGTGVVIGEGYHHKAGSAHAEINALNAAKSNCQSQIKGCTAYVTLEPCSHFGRTPPCSKALIEAGVSHVIIAMVDPDSRVSGNGINMLLDAGIKVQTGLLEENAKKLNVSYIHNRIHKRPYIRCKLAASLDGKTAMASGESQWITSTEARKDVQRLRAQSCAIICGADSVLFDNARMNVRWAELGEVNKNYPIETLRQPLRIVIDSQKRLTPELALFQQQSPVLIIRGDKENKADSKLENLPVWPHFVKVVYLPRINIDEGKLKIDLKKLITFLAEQGLNEILLESGAKLCGAFIEQNLVNEIICYQAPKLIGGDGKNLLEMPGITKLKEAKALSISDIRMVGEDIRITSQFINIK
jgi:diaminohydroxyphosphoribosylaminopyrimidine deaminase/5-amino-6-(5-phosphoribosylamino)uracil reductase